MVGKQVRDSGECSIDSVNNHGDKTLQVRFDSFYQDSWFPASLQGEPPADFELLAAKVKVKLGVLWGDAFTIVSLKGNQMAK